MAFLRPRIFLLVCLMLVSYVPAFAASWTEPTPEELKMTSDPAAPDAPAVYLFREETADDKRHQHTLYARVKILNEKGKQEFSEIAIPYSEIETPYEAGTSEQNVIEVQGRTVEPDGTVVPFTGQPYNKEVVQVGGEKIMEKVFSLPDIRLGSIIEYRYVLTYGTYSLRPPDWSIQQPIFVHRAHYQFYPSDTISTIMTTDSLGHTSNAHHLVYFAMLPPGSKLNKGVGGFDLETENVPPLPDEQFTAPLSSISYRLVFYYTSFSNQQEFWKQEGKYWSKDVDRFADPSEKIKAAVAQIVAPGDSDEQKLHKIYAAVMTVENTDFTRQHSAAENRAEGQELKTAADIWEQKRGSGTDINRLFLAMVRASGMKAYAMAVTARNRALLNQGYLYWGQLTDEISIVSLAGKDLYFDPGERYCEYGKLNWIHTQMTGIRQIDGGTKVAVAPAGDYRDNIILRNATVTIGPDDTLQGHIQITMIGVEALKWRQQALRTDEEATTKAFEKNVQSMVPDGVHVKMNHFLALNDAKSSLIALLDVTGTLGMVAGKRAIIPATFFESETKPLFAPEKRENPIDLRYPSEVQDTVQVTLAPGLRAESLPKDITTVSPLGAEYKSVNTGTATSFKQVRLLAIANTIFTTKEYPQLRDFFQSANADDHQQAVLEKTRTAAGSANGQ